MREQCSRHGGRCSSNHVHNIDNVPLTDSRFYVMIPLYHCGATTAEMLSHDKISARNNGRTSDNYRPN